MQCSARARSGSGRSAPKRGPEPSASQSQSQKWKPACLPFLFSSVSPKGKFRQAQPKGVPPIQYPQTLPSPRLANHTNDLILLYTGLLYRSTERGGGGRLQWPTDADDVIAQEVRVLSSPRDSVMRIALASQWASEQGGQPARLALLLYASPGLAGRREESKRWHDPVSLSPH